MGSGIEAGNNRAEKALLKAIDSPLLEGYSLDGAKGIVANICGSSSMTMEEFHEITALIHQKVHAEATVITGLVIDEDLKDSLQVTVIASGLKEPKYAYLP
jgi:cell division protein FtsZ